MRGRGFVIRSGGHNHSTGSASSGNNSQSGSTGLLMPGGARADLFRSRSLNTSRPPSMHVDDFTKLVKDESATVETVS